MIKSFRSKALAKLWASGKTSKIDQKMHRRLLVRLDMLDAAGLPEDMNLPGFDFHALRGFSPTRYTIHVNGALVHHLRIRERRRLSCRFRRG